jgi:hypothetical protein
MPDLRLSQEDRIHLHALGIATEEDNIFDAAKDWTEGRTTLEEATKCALDDIGTRRSSRAFSSPAVSRATVPAETYDALLHSYQHLDAQMAPVYRALRDAQRSRDNWRLVAYLGIAADLVYGLLKLLEWITR